jgi:3-phytase
VDPENQCLLLCDEITRDIKVYSLDGKFTGRVFGKGIFQGEPEGLVLVRQSETSPEQGYYLIAEQRPFLTLLHLFDRKTYEEKAVFTGNPNLANTDGIAFYQGDFGPFKQGALFCVHDDVRVQAYSWGDVLKTLGQ